jgi:hypothetical protein
VPDSLITGRWLATEGVAFAPWTFDLRAEGNRLTGTVSQGGADGKGWATSLTTPVAISDGRIDGNAIAFTVINPQASNRRILFKGQVDGDEIRFQRDFEPLSGGGLGRDGIYGQYGASQFVAKRESKESNQPRLSRSISGTWVAQGVPNGPWTWELSAAGTRVTGTVRQASGESGPMDIFEGAIAGPAVFFKAKSPDGDRTIAFTGMIHGDEMTVLRVVEVRSGGSSGSGGVFSVSSPQVVLARRTPGTASD